MTVEPNKLKRVGGTTTLTVEFEDYPTVDPFPQRRPIIDPSTGATGRDLPALEIVEIEPRPGLETRGLAPARRYRVTVGPVMNVPLYVELRANYGGDSLSALLRLE